MNIDTVAAHNLLLALRITPSVEQMKVAEEHFAKQRRDLSEWLSSKHSRELLAELECEQRERGGCDDAGLIHRVIVQHFGSARDETRAPVRRGKILRSMLRTARQRVG